MPFIAPPRRLSPDDADARHLACDLLDRGVDLLAGKPFPAAARARPRPRSPETRSAASCSRSYTRRSLTATSVSPASRSPSRYSASGIAPVMHAEYSAPSSTTQPGSSSATMSDMEIRPPGLSTRAISANTFRFSGERLMTQFDMTRSTEPDSTGRSSMSPSRTSTFERPAAAAFSARARSWPESCRRRSRAPGARDLRGEQKIDTGAGAEIEHRVPLADRGESDGIPAAERIDDRVRREAPPSPRGCIRRASPRLPSRPDRRNSCIRSPARGGLLHGARVGFRNVVPDLVRFLHRATSRTRARRRDGRMRRRV